MLKIRYFASVREALNSPGEDMPKPDEVRTVADLMQHLRATNPAFEALCKEQERILCAVNQTVAAEDHPLNDDDEVAFFPPMTGG